MATLGKVWLTKDEESAEVDVVQVELEAYKPDASLGRPPTALTAQTPATPQEAKEKKLPNMLPKTPEEERLKTDVIVKDVIVKEDMSQETGPVRHRSNASTGSQGV